MPNPKQTYPANYAPVARWFSLKRRCEAMLVAIVRQIDYELARREQAKRKEARKRLTKLPSRGCHAIIGPGPIYCKKRPAGPRTGWYCPEHIHLWVRKNNATP